MLKGAWKGGAQLMFAIEGGEFCGWGCYGLLALLACLEDGRQVS